MRASRPVLTAIVTALLLEPAGCSLIVEVGDLARDDGGAPDTDGQDVPLPDADADAPTDGDDDSFFVPLRPCSGDSDCSASGMICNETWGVCAVADCAGRADFTPCELMTDPDRATDVCIDGVCVSPGCGDESCNAPGPSFRLADTSQRLCYGPTVVDCPGTPGDPSCGFTEYCGQDAQYGWDAGHDVSERFDRTEVVANEPIVTDRVTGLVWQGCAAGLGGSGCTTGSGLTMPWREALSYCELLAWAGHEDWGLPDSYELQSIVDYGRSAGPAIHSPAFPATPAAPCWTSSAYGDDVNVQTVDFATGYVTAQTLTTGQNIRCVRRTAMMSVVERFRRAEPVPGEPVVSDEATGLMWQGCVAGLTSGDCSAGTAATFTWQEALAYCEGLSWAALADWYLPNIDELMSIANSRMHNPAVDPTAFPGTPPTHTRSSTIAAAASGMTAVGYFAYAATAAGGRMDPRNVRCVRQMP